MSNIKLKDLLEGFFRRGYPSMPGIPPLISPAKPNRSSAIPVQQPQPQQPVSDKQPTTPTQQTETPEQLKVFKTAEGYINQFLKSAESSRQKIINVKNQQPETFKTHFENDDVKGAWADYPFRVDQKLTLPKPAAVPTPTTETDGDSDEFSSFQSMVNDRPIRDSVERIVNDFTFMVRKVAESAGANIQNLGDLKKVFIPGPGGGKTMKISLNRAQLLYKQLESLASYVKYYKIWNDKLLAQQRDYAARYGYQGTGEPFEPRFVK